jgi:hypothetical protein
VVFLGPRQSPDQIDRFPTVLGFGQTGYDARIGIQSPVTTRTLGTTPFWVGGTDVHNRLSSGTLYDNARYLPVGSAVPSRPTRIIMVWDALHIQQHLCRRYDVGIDSSLFDRVDFDLTVQLGQVQASVWAKLERSTLFGNRKTVKVQITEIKGNLLGGSMYGNNRKDGTPNIPCQKKLEERGNSHKSGF